MDAPIAVSALHRDEPDQLRASPHPEKLGGWATFDAAERSLDAKALADRPHGRDIAKHFRDKLAIESRSSQAMPYVMVKAGQIYPPLPRSE